MSRRLDLPSPSSPRNVHMFDDDGHVVGGLWQNGCIVKSMFYEMCRVFITTKEFTLFCLNNDGSTGAKLFPNRNALQAGSYIVLSANGSPVPVEITPDFAQRRVTTKGESTKLSSRTKSFHDRIIARDDQCVISGIPQDESLQIFNAAHIFPFAREKTWIKKGMARFITDAAPPAQQGETKIHSVQNGLLLKSDIHKLFDIYALTVNVDEGYKIVCLTREYMNLDGRRLALCCRDPQSADRVPDELLRWHHREAILARMKGGGEKPWDMHYPQGADIMQEIREGPDAAERMEAELFTRLGPGEFSISPEVTSP
ncbi:hypothetical protein VF21_03464 [Pseudogymnoascus sp. 05NY08]|nr:hypothetical protein VF21_03464 [Pseudogymnoascus sp. 05NY08]